VTVDGAVFVEARTEVEVARIGVMGLPYWRRVATELLRRAGFAPEEVVPAGRGGLVRWLGGRTWRRLGAVHHVGGPTVWRTAAGLRMTGRPVVWHWIGSDLLAFKRSRVISLDRVLGRRAAGRWAAAHCADSPQLAEELAAAGVAAAVVRLLPAKIEATVADLPAEPAVLSYWSDEKFAFYQGPLVFDLARAFPGVKFRIVGAGGRGVDAPPNVEFLGFLGDMEEAYRVSTVLIRMPLHDSLSAMVLEMLARGRYVIYNQPLECCHRAGSFEEAKASLAEILERRGVNTAGAAMVRERFSLDVEAAKLKSLYARILK